MKKARFLVVALIGVIMAVGLILVSCNDGNDSGGGGGGNKCPGDGGCHWTIYVLNDGELYHDIVSCDNGRCRAKHLTFTPCDCHR